MKRVILLFTLMHLSFQVLSQMITIDQAIAYRAKPVSVFEELMVSKKWSLLSVEKPSAGSLGSIGFAYNKSRFDDKAEGFATLYYNEYSQKYNRLSLQVVSNKDYSTAISRIKVLGGKLISSEIEEAKIIKVYQLKNTIIKVITKTEVEEYEGTNTKYLFFLLALEDYNSLIATENEEPIITTDSTTTSYDEVSEQESKLRELAMGAFNTENFKDAIAKFLQLINIKANNSLDLYYLAYSYLALDKYTNAIKWANAYRKLEPNDVDVTLLLAECYYRSDNIKSAIQFQMQSCELSDTADNNVTLSWYLLLDKQYEKSSDYLSKAEEQHEYSDDDLFHIIQMNKAHLYLVTGKYQTAKLLYTKYKGYIVRDKTWEELILEDFEVMKKYKIVNPDIEKIKLLLK